MIGLMILAAVHMKAGELYGTCNVEPYGACAAYVGGVVDALHTLGLTGHDAPCVSEAAPMEKKLSAIAAYLRYHGDRLDWDASDVVIDALSASFPCRR